MLPIRFFLFGFFLFLSGFLLAQQPAAKLSKGKMDSDKKVMLERKEAYQQYSDAVIALSKKKQDPKAAITQLAKLSKNLHERYPCDGFPNVLFGTNGKPISLKKQQDVYASFLPEATKVSVEGQTESGGFAGYTEDQLFCLLEYMDYGINESIDVLVLGYTFVVLVEEHQAFMQNVYNQKSVCNVGHSFIAIENDLMIQYLGQ